MEPKAAGFLLVLLAGENLDARCDRSSTGVSANDTSPSHLPSGPQICEKSSWRPSSWGVYFCAGARRRDGGGGSPGTKVGDGSFQLTLKKLQFLYFIGTRNFQFNWKIFDRTPKGFPNEEKQKLARVSGGPFPSAWTNARAGSGEEGLWGVCGGGLGVCVWATRALALASLFWGEQNPTPPANRRNLGRGETEARFVVKTARTAHFLRWGTLSGFDQKFSS